MKPLLCLLLTGCAVGPVAEARLPLGFGHDWEGLVGVEATYGRWSLLYGIDHPWNGVEEKILRVSYKIMFWGL